MRLALIIGLALAAACSPPNPRQPLPDGGCVTPRQECVAANGASGTFDAGCPTGFGCFPATGCAARQPCGACVDLEGKPPNDNYNASCEVCGPCTFATGGIAGFQAPASCREGGSGGRCCDHLSSCRVD